MNSFRTQIFHCWFLLILIFSINSIYAQQSDDDSGYKIRTVVIDPGHGGKDPGTVGKHSTEKEVVLAIGLKLGAYIEQYFPDVKVIYTRKTDEFPPLYRRAEIANENNADLFISIHANGVSSPKAYGTETLVLGLHRTEENFEVAQRENSVILLEEDYETRYENFDPNSPESYIMFSLMQNVYDIQSVSFADLVQDQFRERVKRFDRGVKRQGLLVLAQISMPGVLVETGFLSNPDEEQYLLSEQGQDYIASAIYRAFKEYKSDIDSKSTGSVIVKSESETKNVPDLTPEEADNPEQKLEDNSDITEEAEEVSSIYFKVQITSSVNSLALDSKDFLEFTDVEEFKIDTSYKYAVGYKNNYSEIVEYSKWVKNRYPDAFIIAVRNGNIIPVKDAIKQLDLN